MINNKSHYNLCNKEDYDWIVNHGSRPCLSYATHQEITSEYVQLYVNVVGQDHYLFGPSLVSKYGMSRFHINDNEYSEKQYWREIEYLKLNEPQLFELSTNLETQNKVSKNQIITQSTITKKEIKMSNKAPFMEMMKDNTVDAAYRSGAKQFTKMAKAAILSQLSKNTSSEGIAAVSNLLDTEMGTATMSMLMGLGIHYAPGISEDPRAARLAQEFQVAGLAVGFDQIFGMLTSTLLPAFQEAMKSLPSVEVAVKPSKTNKRIKVKEVLDEDDEESTELHSSKAAR